MIDALEIRSTRIEGLLVLRSRTVRDERGSVRELFRASAFAEAGIAAGPWPQLNLTESRPGAIRGIHGETTAKLVGVAAGEAFGAYVDLRAASPSRGEVVTVELRAGVQVLVPPGVGNGFQTTGTAPSWYVYCFDREWAPDMPGLAVNPLDPDLRIRWPIDIDRHDRSLLSAKDAQLPLLREAAAWPPDGVDPDGPVVGVAGWSRTTRNDVQARR